MNLPLKLYCEKCEWQKFILYEDFNKIDILECPKCGSNKIKAAKIRFENSSESNTAKEIAKYVKMLLREDDSLNDRI